MTSNKHAPGPWIARKGAGWIVTRPDASKRREAALAVGMTPATSLIGDGKANAWYDEIECEANAKLMAASPKLLAAVRAFVAWLDAEEGKPEYGTLTRDTHPEGERIWREWFDRNLRLCAEAQKQGREVLAEIEGDT